MCRLRSAILLTAITIATGACADAIAPPLFGGIRITPAGATTMLIGPGGGQQLQFTAQSGSREVTAQQLRRVVWHSNAPDVLSVTERGVAIAEGIGTAVLIAQLDAMFDSAWVQVRPVPVASLFIALDAIELEVGPYGGSVRTLSTVARDSAGHRLPAPIVQWRASDANIAEVTSHGVLTAVGPGDAWVHASANGHHDSSAVTVTATLDSASGVAVHMRDAQWTQGVQRSDGSIPVISGGRAAVLNVTTRASGSVTTPTLFVLRLFDARGALIHAESSSVAILSGTSTTREPTVQFLVAPQLLTPGLRWDVVRDPGRLAPDGVEGAETYPASGHAPVRLVSAPPLRLRFVPIILEVNGGARGPVTAALLDYYTRTVRALFPHGRIDATIGDPHRTFVPFGTAGYGGDVAFWRALLAELDTRRVADPEHADAHWIGVVRPPVGFTYTMYGGIAYVPSDGQSIDPGTRTAVVIGANWAYRESYSQDLVAHELGHNLGRLHAPCGTNGSLDYSFPDSRGVIGDGAHNTIAWERGVTVGAMAVPAGTADFMGYCAPSWISAHSYSGMLAFRAVEASLRREPRVRQRVLVVRGTVDARATRLDAPEVVDAAPSAQDPTGAWLLEGLAADGTVLFRWPFSLSRWGDAPEGQPFALAVPFDEATELRLVTLRVSGTAWTAERRMR